MKAIERYRSLYEHVIVDCAATLDELNLDLLEAATRVLLVVTPEMGALHNTARFLGLAEMTGRGRVVPRRLLSQALVDKGLLEKTGS